MAVDPWGARDFGGMAVKFITLQCRTVTSGVSGVCDNEPAVAP